SFETVKNGPIRLGRLTALQFACGMANYEAVEALVQAGADGHAADGRGATRLVFAVATDHADPRVVKLLLDRGAERGPALEWARRYQNPAILPMFGLSAEKPGASAAGTARRGAR